RNWGQMRGESSSLVHDLQLQGTTCIVPGLVLQNDVMVCDRGGRPYNPKPTNVQK
ncbi:hypothetical protein BaRGS_00038831, partial [Batillaria attramentaria]